MSYKLSQRGWRDWSNWTLGRDSKLYCLTDLQKKALTYLYDNKDEKRYIDAHEIALFYGYPSGLYFRGVLASLYKKGLIDKEES